MTTATIVEWASATKPVTCGAAAMLWQRGLFDLDDPVCRHIPEFAAEGKEQVTIRHLLTHTAGLTDPTKDLMPFAEAVAAVCRAPLIAGSIPGARCAYNSVGMWAVAELVARLSGQPFSEFVRERVFEPLRLTDSWIGVPAGVFRSYGDRVAIIPRVKESGTESWVTWGRPTGGGFGPIRDLGRYYVSLLEHRLLSAPVVEAMTTRHLCGIYDERLESHVDRGLGFMLGSTYRGHGFGPHASKRSFGHGGRQWCVAFADPERQLATAVYWNGKPGIEEHADRLHGLLGDLYVDLGLA
jgi:CubicO group peptidase (beta-lactamase class C family)